MASIVIFGISDSSQLAKYYIENDPEYSQYSVVAFTVDREFMPEGEFEGLPVVDFNEVDEVFPPSNNLMFIPITATGMNNLRSQKYLEAKKRGYSFFSYVSSSATILTNSIGENCFILEDNTIQPFVTVGNNVVMWSGNHIGHHSVIGDNAYFTSHVVLSGHCKVGNNSWFGVNSTIRDNCKIGEYCLVGMGALVTTDTDSFGLYVGSPAKKQVRLSTEVF